MTRIEALTELGLAESSSWVEIRRAYFRLLKQRNPERDPDGFKRLREALECLKGTGGEGAGGDEAEPPGPGAGERVVLRFEPPAPPAGGPDVRPDGGGPDGEPADERPETRQLDEAPSIFASPDTVLYELAERLAAGNVEGFQQLDDELLTWLAEHRVRPDATMLMTLSLLRELAKAAPELAAPVLATIARGLPCMDIEGTSEKLAALARTQRRVTRKAVGPLIREAPQLADLFRRSLWGHDGFWEAKWPFITAVVIIGGIIIGSLATGASKRDPSTRSVVTTSKAPKDPVTRRQLSLARQLAEAHEAARALAVEADAHGYRELAAAARRIAGEVRNCSLVNLAMLAALRAARGIGPESKVMPLLHRVDDLVARTCGGG